VRGTRSRIAVLYALPGGQPTIRSCLVVDLSETGMGPPMLAGYSIASICNWRITGKSLGAPCVEATTKTAGNHKLAEFWRSRRNL